VKNNPLHPEKPLMKNWEVALKVANSVKRCGAKTRNSAPCRSPAMKNGRCRMHGGKSTGAPKGNQNAYKTGKYTEAMVARRQFLLELMKRLH